MDRAAYATGGDIEQLPYGQTALNGGGTAAASTVTFPFTTRLLAAMRDGAFDYPQVELLPQFCPEAFHLRQILLLLLVQELHAGGPKRFHYLWMVYEM